MKRLWRVELTHVLYVVTEEEVKGAAQDTAEDVDQSQVHNENPESVIATEVIKRDAIDREWRDALPYGIIEDKTCEQVFTEIEPEIKKRYDDPNQMKLPFGE